MIADILMYISIICMFLSLIPASISDYKTRTVDPKIWRYAAYIGIPCALFAFCIKLIYFEIVIPSLILLLASVLIIIIITIILATIKDPLYNPTECSNCKYEFTKKSDITECPNCNHINAKSILGGADMIAIDLIMITSFYISQSFITIFILSFIIACIMTMIVLMIQSKSMLNYRIPLIIPITIGYALTLLFILTDILKFI
jgi:hypothetical protein